MKNHKNKQATAVKRPWPIYGKLLFWVLAPGVGFVLMFFYIYAAMTFMDSMAINAYLLSPFFIILLGFLYFVLLSVIERPFVRYERMYWWQFGIGAYLLSCMLTFVLWLVENQEYRRYPEGTANEDLEFMTYLFLTMTAYAAVAAVFRVLFFLVQQQIDRIIRKKNEEKLSRYRELTKKKNKNTDTSAVFRDVD